MSVWFTQVERMSKKKEPYIIAELGSNYKSTQDLLEAISLAKACGAHAIKYQYLTTSELYGPTYKINKDFPLAALKEKALSVGIEFLCSAFSPEGMAEVDKFVVAHKIASCEMAHLRMLEKAIELNKPVILSCGAYFLPDITAVLSLLQKLDVILMHCNVAYPTQYTDVQKFGALKQVHSGIIGYSDHTTVIDAVPLYFQSLGATVFEKHFNPFGYTDTDDAPHSLTTDAFKAYCQALKGEPINYSEENEARLKHVRRVVATANIEPGDTLIEGVNIGIFRSRHEDATGSSPLRIARLEGKTAKRQIALGFGVSGQDAG